jgi:DNA polymerase III subunit epsilon
MAEFVIYDLETTGLRPEQEEIIQIAAMRFRQGKQVGAETFFSYARPQRPISTFITHYTGIRNADVLGAPRPHEVLQEFSRFVGQAGLIAHNGHRFDSKFLGATCRRHQLSSVEVSSIDSINLSKRIFGTVRGTGHSLDRVLARLGISAAGCGRRHDARADVELLGRAVEKMWHRLGLDSDGCGLPTHTSHLPINISQPERGCTL